MSALFHVTIRSETNGEVIEFNSTQPVLHVDMPAGALIVRSRALSAS